MRQGRDRPASRSNRGSASASSASAAGDLDGHFAIQLRIPRPVDLSHPARPQGCEDLVGTEAGAERASSHFAPATSFWKRGFLRSESKVGSIVSHARETRKGTRSTCSRVSTAFSGWPVRA